MKILLADDEKELTNALYAILKFNKYDVDCVYNGTDAYEAALENNYDALILDIMMPEKSGVEVVAALREKNIDVPIILLTAKSEFSDKIAGLDAGADDYLTKPFNAGELLARLRALLRRTEQKNEYISIGNITLNKETMELKSDSSSLRLSARESKVFELLAARPDTPIPERQFLDKIFDNEEDEDRSEVVFLYISYLRTKLTAISADVEISVTPDNKYVMSVS